MNIRMKFAWTLLGVLAFFSVAHSATHQKLSNLFLSQSQSCPQFDFDASQLNQIEGKYLENLPFLSSKAHKNFNRPHERHIHVHAHRHSHHHSH